MPGRPITRLETLQVFRGVAAAMVVLFHLPRLMGGLFLFGHSGIDFFFVLSGFVMLYGHHAEAGNRRAVLPFLRARFTRIYPAYWVVLAITLACALYQPEVLRNPLDAAALARAVGLYDQLNGPVVPIAWTLSFEIAFYLFFVLYLLLGAAVFAGAALVWCGFVLAQWAGLVRLACPLLLSPLMLEFFLGCVGAVLVLRFAPAVRGVWVVAAVLLCLGVGLADSYRYIDSNQNVRNYALPFFLLITLGAWHERASGRRYPEPLLLLGDASYSIYLVHVLGIRVLFRLLYDHPALVDALGSDAVLWLVWGLLVAGGIAFHLAVERPLLGFVRRALAVERRLSLAPGPAAAVAPVEAQGRPAFR